MPICSCLYCKFKMVSLAKKTRHAGRVRATDPGYGLVASDPGYFEDSEEENCQKRKEAIMAPPTKSRKKMILGGARDRRYLRRTQRADKFDEIDAQLARREQAGLDADLVIKFTKVYKEAAIRDFYNWRP